MEVANSEIWSETPAKSSITRVAMVAVSWSMRWTMVESLCIASVDSPLLCWMPPIRCEISSGDGDKLLHMASLTSSLMYR
jgi:hypothetical protein